MTDLGGRRPPAPAAVHLQRGTACRRTTRATGPTTSRSRRSPAARPHRGGAQPAVLVGCGDLTPAGAALSVSGWGGPPTARPPELRAVACSPSLTATRTASRTTRRTSTARRCSARSRPGKDSCSGDSGGPLTPSDGTLIGLVSWGLRTRARARTGRPGVYTELAEPVDRRRSSATSRRPRRLEYTPRRPRRRPRSPARRRPASR